MVPSPPMVVGIAFVLEFSLRVIAACILATAAVSVGAALADGRGRSPVMLRLTAVAIATLWILTVVFHLLIALHAFRLPVVLLLLPGIALAFRRSVRGQITGRHFLRWWRTGRWRQSWFTAGAAIFGILAVRALFVPPVSWDSLTYHLVKAALWVQGGGPIALRAPGGGGAYMDVPGGVDALWAWVMLPFHSDLLVGVADVAGYFLLGAGVYGLGRELGARARLAALGAAFVMAMPSALMAAGSNYVDNMVAFYLTAATAFALRYLRRGEPGCAILAAMAGGLAAGSKLTAVPLLAVFLVAILLRAWRGGSRPTARRVIAVSAAAALLVSAPWYLRTWIATGYPLSPYPVRVAGIVLGVSADADWYGQQRPVAQPYTFAAEWPALLTMFHDPFSNTLGPVAAIPVAILPATLFWLWRRHRPSAILLGTLLAAALQTYLSPQYAVTRLGWARMSGRYFLHPVAIAVTLGLAAFPAAPLTTVLALATALNLWFHGGLYWTGLELTLVLSYLGVLALAVWLAGRFSGGIARTTAVAVLSVACLGVGQAGRDLFRYELAASAIVTHEAPRFPAEALAAVNGQVGRTVAFTSGPYQVADNWLVYPFLGSRLQNTPVYVPISRSGRLIPHPDPEYLKDADVEAWLARLEALQVEVVVSFSPSGPELAWMESRPVAFPRIAGDGQDWGVYERRSLSRAGR
jgi:4-amino-4-deoxy-L-arabinose transferase-like glycosyltransferase